jgi:biofilm protein TabA
MIRMAGKVRSRQGNATMITDTIENASAYFSLSPRLPAALRFLRQTDLAVLSPGRHSIDGENAFAIVQEYQTKPRAQGLWEAHRRYIDVQFVQSGVEAMGWAPIQQMRVKQPYDSEKDLEFFDGSGQMIEVPAGHFAIFLPHDVHMPGLCIAEPQSVRKIVMKVAVE